MARQKTIFTVLIMLIISLLAGCGVKEYIFKKSVSEIRSIEIVSAKSSLDFDVIKTLSKDEKDDFIERFCKLKFNSYYFGDPMAVDGSAVKITYSDGDYEIICDHWAEYVKSGEIYFIRKNCNEYEFNELLNSFSE